MTIIQWLGIGVMAILLAIVLAFLAFQRGDIPYATLEARYAAPTSHYMDLPGGVHLHYRDEGKPDGPVLLLVHGFGASAADWDDWAGRLGDRYRIIAPDLPAFGLTRAPKDWRMGAAGQVEVVDQLVERLGLKGFVIGGNSMGGGVAWRYALAHPDKVRGVVLVDAAGWPPKATSQKGPLVFRLLGNPVARVLIKNIDATSLVKQGLESAFVDPTLVTPALVKRYTDLSRAPGHRDLILGGRSGGSADDIATKARLANLSAPTLIMVGEDDRVIASSDGERFRDAIPGSKLISYPGVGHVPMEQIPEKSAADLRAWLDALDAPRATAEPPHRILVRELPPAR
jgi:pimeloyl-ACP methyl ester carboxylesterase